MTQLTEHFSLEELTASAMAARYNIPNVPGDDVLPKLMTLAQGLEQVRALLGVPMMINSGYRSQALNDEVHGVAHSAHELGYAADFVAPAYGTPLAIVQLLAKDPGVRFDQVIQEGTWVHISFDPALRQQVLTAHFDNGVATYTQGV